MSLCVRLLFLLITVYIFETQTVIVPECSKIANSINDENLLTFMKASIPSLEGKKKGEAGKIAVVGGSVEYTGAPYFAALSALRVGADLVFVITTETAAPIIKTYSPDLIVIPYFRKNITSLILGRDIVILGPGLGREQEAQALAYEVIALCRKHNKPLVIDADGLYAIYKNTTILKDFPSPGAILTPNHAEVKRLKDAIPLETKNWYEYWGEYVTVLEKGEKDHYRSSMKTLDWTIHDGGSGRRAGGQGDILAGALGTFLNWALKANICENKKSIILAHSVASYAAAKFTRSCNQKAYVQYGRSMLASDMLHKIHETFEDLFI